MTHIKDIHGYLPEPIRSKCHPKLLHLLKFGYLGLQLVPPLVNRLNSGDPDASLAKEFWDLLIDIFKKSPNIMEIQCEKNTKDLRETPLLGYGHRAGSERITLLSAIEVRVALSEQQREKYGMFNPAPKEFWIFYDGGLFFAVRELSSIIPDMSSFGFGPAARDFLKSVVEQGTAWKTVEWAGPTPMHPNIYLLGVEIKPEEELLSKENSLVIAMPDNNIMVVYSAAATMFNVVRRMRDEVMFGLEEFYEGRMISDSINNEIEAIAELNEQLTGTLATFFEHSAIRAVLTRIPRKTRRLLSQLHLRLQKLSTLEVQLRNTIRRMEHSIAKSDLLTNIRAYMSEHVGAHEEIDKDAQLRLMNYTTSETGSFSIIQATLWASVVGAIVGSVITLLFK